MSNDSLSFGKLEDRLIDFAGRTRAVADVLPEASLG